MPRRYTAREIHSLAEHEGIDYVIETIAPSAIEDRQLRELLQARIDADGAIDDFLKGLD